MNTTEPIIRVNIIGLERHKTYIFHEKEEMMPDPLKSDYLQHPLLPSGDGLALECKDDFLEEGEEFRVAVPVKDEKEARLIYEERMDKGVHLDSAFSFDPTYNIFWVLAESHPIIRAGFDNPSNIKLTLPPDIT